LAKGAARNYRRCGKSARRALGVLACSERMKGRFNGAITMRRCSGAGGPDGSTTIRRCPPAEISITLMADHPRVVVADTFEAARERCHGRLPVTYAFGSRERQQLFVSRAPADTIGRK